MLQALPLQLHPLPQPIPKSTLASENVQLLDYLVWLTLVKLFLSALSHHVLALRNMLDVCQHSVQQKLHYQKIDFLQYSTPPWPNLPQLSEVWLDCCGLLLFH
jgi:hypothetical protein